jgi:predicted ATPase/DNA-binding winged helix-turn-helix (wHTH) protein
MLDQSETVLSFGPFRLLPLQRLLLDGERPVRIGSRVLDILLLLTERAGDLVGKDELVTRVWGGLAVEEATLRVHVTTLRKILGHGQNGVRYVENVSGRGYCFVAVITHRQTGGVAVAAPVTAEKRRYRLPAPLARMIGRDEIVDSLAARLTQERLLTIVGPGGMGKTTVALAIAHKLSASYEHGACFVDLALIADPALMPGILSSALGVEILSEDVAPALLEFSRDKHLLIVLDNCEHVVDVVADLAERLLKVAPQLSILATSREPLRAEGEAVHWLGPLASPQSMDGLTVGDALTFPAIQFFAERAHASSDSFTLIERADISIVVELCRRLDGIPLAIELAAARIDLFGVRGLADRIENCLRVLTKSRRTALPRQQTLRATLDWSHDLLSGQEQVIFRRLAVFPADFDLLSATAIAADTDISIDAVAEAISDLGAKSLLTASVSGEHVRFRLLETSRAYATEKLELSDEGAEMRHRHATFLVAEWNTEKAHLSDRPEHRETYCRKIEDVRAALDWELSAAGDALLGIKLAITSAPLWFQLSLVEEYRRYLHRALQAIAAEPQTDSALAMKLNAMLGYALLHTKGPVPDMANAFTQSLEIAHQLNDVDIRWRSHWGLGMAEVAKGNYFSAVDLAERARLDARRCGDGASIMSDRFAAVAHHFAGDLARSRLYAEDVLGCPASMMASTRNDYYQLDQKVAARALLSRNLWLQGFPDQAAKHGRQGVMEAQAANHALSTCIALTCAAQVLLWRRDGTAAKHFIAVLLDHSGLHGLTFWHFWGQCLEVSLAFQTADSTGATEDYAALLRDPLVGLHQLEFLATTTEDLLEAKVMVRAEAGDAGWCGPELLRAKGLAILRQDAADASVAAEALFRRSLEIAREQGALSWQLRTATSLARLWRNDGRPFEARDLLAPIYAQFTEGFATADLITARVVLDELATGA